MYVGINLSYFFSLKLVRVPFPNEGDWNLSELESVRIDIYSILEIVQKLAKNKL